MAEMMMQKNDDPNEKRPLFELIEQCLSAELSESINDISLDISDMDDLSDDQILLLNLSTPENDPSAPFS